jgi:hypothetical protein
MMHRRALLLALVAACHPWYLDGEVAGRRATDRKHASALVDKARDASSHGDHARAEALLRQAIDEVPDLDADTYLLLAREASAAADFAGARAAARRGIQLFPGDGRFRQLLVEERVADDLTAEAIDIAGATTFAEAAQDPALAPHLDALSRALAADRADTAAGELTLWLAHYGAPDHVLLRKAREEAAARISSAIESSPSLAGLARAADRADAELAAGRLPRALALYGEVYRLLPATVLDAHFAGFAKAAQQASDPEMVDNGAYKLALDGDRDAKAGLLGLAIRDYRKAIARAPWWIDAHRNLAALFDAADRSEEAAAERAFVERLTK